MQAPVTSCTEYISFVQRLKTDMKCQNGPANTDQKQISNAFSRSELLDEARFRPKIGDLRVVSSHPLTLLKPD